MKEGKPILTQDEIKQRKDEFLAERNKVYQKEALQRVSKEQDAISKNLRTQSKEWISQPKT